VAISFDRAENIYKSM